MPTSHQTLTKQSKPISTNQLQLLSFVDSCIFRIDSKYYDLTDFCSTHPGGQEILVYAKRKTWDHTQLFSIHHVHYLKAKSIMNKFLITDPAMIDRIEHLIAIEVPQRFPSQLPVQTSKYYPKYLHNSGIQSEYKPCDINPALTKWTFDDLRMADCAFELPEKGSFYWELRQEIYKYFKQNNLSYYPTPFYMCAWWAVAILSFVLQFMQYWYKSYVIALLIGCTYLILGGYGHQFIHNPVLFRKYAYLSLDWIGLYSYQYMVDHCILHHIHTNTIPDHHFNGTDPFVYVNPLTPRHYWRKIFNFFMYLVSVSVGILANYLFCWSRVLSRQEPFYWSIFLYPLSGAFMCAIVRDIRMGLALSLVTTAFTSGYYFTIALMNHNQSENWDMDRLTKAAKSSDKNGGWAEMQLVTSSDIGYNYGFVGSALCLWLNYHTVHHLLPTIDMSHHSAAQAILNRVSAKHGLQYQYKPAWDMFWEMLGTFSTARAVEAMTGYE